MVNTKHIGNISEAKVLHEFLKRGFSVSIPYGNNSPYDFVIEGENKFFTIQVKTARSHSSNCSCIFNTKSNGISYKGKIDYFVVYYPKIDKVFIIPEHKIKQKADKVVIRFGKSTSNFNSKTMLTAEQYELDNFLSLK